MVSWGTESTFSLPIRPRVDTAASRFGRVNSVATAYVHE